MVLERLSWRVTCPNHVKFPTLDSCQKKFLWTHKEVFAIALNLTCLTSLLSSSSEVSAVLHVKKHSIKLTCSAWAVFAIAVYLIASYMIIIVITITTTNKYHPKWLEAHTSKQHSTELTCSAWAVFAITVYLIVPYIIIIVIIITTTKYHPKWLEAHTSKQHSTELTCSARGVFAIAVQLILAGTVTPLSHWQ